MILDQFKLNGKVAIVTGARTGLGQGMACGLAEAGADIVAPSAMLDGMVAGIRGALDARRFHHIPIMSYSAKFASGFYGPFRDAAEGAEGEDARERRRHGSSKMCSCRIHSQRGWPPDVARVTFALRR